MFQIQFTLKRIGITQSVSTSGRNRDSVSWIVNDPFEPVENHFRYTGSVAPMKNRLPFSKPFYQYSVPGGNEDQ